MTKSGSKPKRPPSPRQRCRYTGVGLTLHCSEDSTSPKAKRVKETRLHEQRARVKDFTPIAPATRLASADAYKMAMDHILDDTSGQMASPDPTLLPPPKFNKAKNSKLSPYARHELDQLLYLSGELGLSSAEVSKRMPGRTEGALSQMWAMGHEWDSYGKSRRLFSAEEDAVIMSLKAQVATFGEIAKQLPSRNVRGIQWRWDRYLEVRLEHLLGLGHAAEDIADVCRQTYEPWTCTEDVLMSSPTSSFTTSASDSSATLPSIASTIASEYASSDLTGPASTDSLSNITMDSSTKKSISLSDAGSSCDSDTESDDMPLRMIYEDRDSSPASQIFQLMIPEGLTQSSLSSSPAWREHCRVWLL